ncbi:MAG TPA: hypothetical protein PLE77_12410 [Kiritimatiellia bacterium]|nr:hypothetical protein [Kiritimatiellia bacterium]
MIEMTNTAMTNVMETVCGPTCCPTQGDNKAFLVVVAVFAASWAIVWFLRQHGKKPLK